MTLDQCLFCRIVAGTEPNWLVWEDDEHVAFLTPFPNTLGFTVVATKKHVSSYAFDLSDQRYTALMVAAKTVGKILDKALNVSRTGLILEGMGIDHAHAKLVPLHGLRKDKWEAVLSNVKNYFSEYAGFISSHDGPRASDEDLDNVAAKIRAVGAVDLVN